LPKRRKEKAAEAKPVLTDVDVKRLWDVFANALAKQGLDSDTYRGKFHENIILTDSYDTNVRVMTDLANRIILDHETSYASPSPVRIEMPPPRVPQTERSDVPVLGQKGLKLVHDQQSLDEKLYEYIVQRIGQDVSLTQASEDLGVTRDEIGRSIDRLCDAGRLPRPSITAIQEQTQRCMYCSAETPLGSKFCIRCGQPQEIRVGVETQLLDSQTHGELEPPLIDQKGLKEHVKAGGERIRFTLPKLFPKREAAERSRTLFPQPWDRQSLHPQRRPFERVRSGALQPAQAKICTKCRHIMRPLGHGNRWYCDRCKRYG